MPLAEVYFYKKPQPLGFDELGFRVEAVGHGTDVKLIGIVDGKSVPTENDIPGKIKGKAFIVQTAEGKLIAIKAPRVNLESMEIDVLDFDRLEPELQTQVLNALRRSRQEKRHRIGQLTKIA